MYDILLNFHLKESLIQKCIRVIGPVEYSEFSCLGQTVDGEGSLCAAYQILLFQ